MHTNDWENPQILARNREPAHATLIPYPDREPALTGERGASAWFKLLNGVWQFYYAPSPLDVPAGCETEAFDTSAWDTIPVPGNWQVHMAVIQNTPHTVQIEIDATLAGYALKPAVACTYCYTVYGTGDVILKTRMTPLSDLPVLPRIGVQIRLPGRLNQFAWYGRGPHESYADRKESARVGLYAGSVQDQYVPYIRPQENGNKSDVRWAAVTDLRGMGLLVVGMPLLNVSIHHYTTEDFASTRHDVELRRRDETILNIDERQAGLGSESCGPGPLPHYLIQPAETTFTVRFTPFSKDAATPMRLSQQRLEVV